MKTVTGPVHTVENTWEADRDLLSAKENDWGMAPVSHYYYSLNALGQRTSVDIDGQGTGGLVVWDWGYDAKGQVVKGDASSGSGATADDRFYDYDQIGNRKQSRTGTFSSTGGTATEYFADTAATTVGANGLNQYQAIKTGGVTRNPVHDSDGNLTDDGANWDYVWDGENRMVSATPKSTSGTRKIIYKYDHLGRLSSRELQIWNGSAWAYHESYRYVYDGWNRIESCVNWMGLRDEYIWGLDLSGTPQGAGGVGGMLLWSTTYDYGANWKNYYPAYDGNGNVTEIVNGSGTVAAHWEYDPFGNILRSTAAGTWSDPVNLFEFRFSTKPQDRNTGLYYYGYRFYDPVTGRWPSKDPIEETGGVNLYQFVVGNPISVVDLLGLSGNSLCCAGGLPKVKDDAGRECCPTELKEIELQLDVEDLDLESRIIGHAQLQLPSDPGKSHGFFPNSDSTWDLLTRHPGLYDNSPHAYNPDHTRTYSACPESEKAVQDSIDKNKNNKYSLSNIGGENCASWACNRLEDAGYDVPWNSDMPGVQPKDLSPNLW